MEEVYNEMKAKIKHLDIEERACKLKKQLSDVFLEKILDKNRGG